MAPSGVVISGLATDIALTQSTSSIAVSTSFDSQSDTRPAVSGSIAVASQATIDTSFNGSGNYTRTDGDTTFVGNATHSESFYSNQVMRLFHWLDNDGQWQLGHPPTPNVTYPESLLSAELNAQYNHRYWAGGTIADSGTTIQWDSTLSSASESGEMRSSLFFFILGTPQQVPPDHTSGDDNSLFEDGPAESHPDSDDLENVDNDSTLPKLRWTYSGNTRSNSRLMLQAERNAVGDYQSDTLDGSISQSFFFRVSAQHESQSDILPEGELNPTGGENRYDSHVQFTFDLDLSGNINNDNPHSGGLAGTVAVTNHTSGGAIFSLNETFAPGLSTGTWDSAGESFDWINFSTQADVNLSGTTNRSIGGVSTGISLTHELFTYASGASASRFTLQSSRPADRALSDEDDWLQIVGIARTDQVTRTESTQSGHSSGGMIDQTSRARSEHSTWSQLYAPETEPGAGQWGDGGKSVDDYFYSLIQATQTNEPLAMPMGDTGGSLNGYAHSQSFDSMLVRSNEGNTWGDGANPPGLQEEDLGDLVGRIRLSVRPPESGHAVPPDPDDPDGASDWASGNYGRIRVSHFGNSSAGFSATGSYNIATGAPIPATATQSVSANSTTAYDFQLRSRMDGASKNWRNTLGTRMTSSTSDNRQSHEVDGGWRTETGGFILAGTFFDHTHDIQTSSTLSLGTLDTSSGSWSTENRDSLLTDFSIDRFSTGTGTYARLDDGVLVSGSVNVLSSATDKRFRSVNNNTIDGAQQSDSSAIGYDVITSHSFVGAVGAGNTRGTETIGGDYYDSNQVNIGQWTKELANYRTVTESISRESSQIDRTEYRYNTESKQFIADNRSLIKSHTISDVAIDDYGLSTLFKSQTSSQIAGVEFRANAKVFDKENWTRTNKFTSTLNQSTQKDFGSSITTSSAIGQTNSEHDIQRTIGHYAKHFNKDGGTNPNFVRTITAKEDVTRTFNDKIVTTTAPDGSGGVTKSGNMTMTGAGNSWRYQQTGEQGTWDYTNTLPNQLMYEYRPGFTVFVPHAATSDSVGNVEAPPPFTDTHVPSFPMVPPVGPGAFSIPVLVTAVMDKISELASLASAATSANQARDAAFAELAEETEAGSESEGEEGEADLSPPSGASMATNYVEAQGNPPPPSNTAAIAAKTNVELNRIGEETTASEAPTEGPANPPGPATVGNQIAIQQDPLNQRVIDELLRNSGQLSPETIQALLDHHRKRGTLSEATSRGRSPKWGFAVPITFPDGSTRYLVIEYIAAGIFTSGKYVVAGVVPRSVDPQHAVEGLITDPHRLNQFDAALKAFEFGMASLPVLSDALDIYEVIFGVDWTTGDRLSWESRNDSLHAAALPGNFSWCHPRMAL